MIVILILDVVLWPVPKFFCNTFTEFAFFVIAIYFANPLYSKIFAIIDCKLFFDILVDCQIFSFMLSHPSVYVIATTHIKDLGVL